ncbi:MAG: TlpA family protein disulfide reductase [Vulcanimicrobiaceae bacterium]
MRSALLLVLLALLAGCSAPSTQAGPSGMVGRMAPSYALMTTHGARRSLRAYRGRVVVLNLWATWCPPCRAEMPDLERLWLVDRARGLVVLGVDQGEGTKRVAEFARSLDVTYPVLLDQRQRYGRAVGALGLPTTLIIDRSGRVVRAFDGALTYSQMRAAVDPVLAVR